MTTAKPVTFLFRGTSRKCVRRGAAGERESRQMNLWGVLNVARRRWFIFFPLLVVVAAAALIVPKDSKPTYTVESIVLIQAPTFEHQQQPGSTNVITRAVNPLLTGDGGLAPTANLLGKIINSGTTAGLVADSGFTGSYVVISTDRQPFLTIGSTSTDKAAATAANHKVFDLIRAEIDRRQAATINDPTQTVTLGYVTKDELRVGQTSKLRVVAVLLIAGILVALNITVVFDAIMTSRSRRRAPRTRSAVASEVSVRL